MIEKELTAPISVKDALSITGLSGQELRRLFKQKAIRYFYPTELSVPPFYKIQEGEVDLTQQIVGDSIFHVGKRKMVKVEIYDLYLINPSFNEEIADVGFKKAKIIYELR